MDAISKALELFEAASEQIEKAEANQVALWKNNSKTIPLLLSANVPHCTGLKRHNYKEIHFDHEKNFENELNGALHALYGRADAVPSIRANMGCSVFPSLLGVAPRLFEDKMPWVKEHLSKEQIWQIKPEDITICNDFKVALEHMAYMRDRLQDSPLRIYPLDLQGPFDTAHIVYGDDIFYDIYDDPEFVHHLMDLSCHALIVGMEACLALIPGAEKSIAHYSNLVMPKSMGGLKISEDTSTLVSAHTIDEFVVPYTKRVLDHFGGGYIHYCGKNDHLFKAMMDVDNVFGFNFGNSDMHDMDMILSEIAKAGKVYYGHVHQLPGETEREYFARVQKSSNSRLLLTYSAGDRDPAEILQTWIQVSGN